MRRGCPLTSQTAFGGQLPYKGSLVQPVVRFGHTYSCIMAGFYEPRTMNHGLSLGFRCGVPPRQIHDGITTVCRPSYIPAMPRIHGGTPATAVRSGSRPAPPDSRYLADQKGSGRPLRWPQMGRFLRAEGYSRRCRHSEAVAAQRHLSPRRPTTGRTPWRPLCEPRTTSHEQRATNNEPRATSH